MSHGLEKLRNQGKMDFFCVYSLKSPKDIFKPAPCKTHVLVAQLKYTNKLV